MRYVFVSFLQIGKACAARVWRWTASATTITAIRGDMRAALLLCLTLSVRARAQQQTTAIPSESIGASSILRPAAPAIISPGAWASGVDPLLVRGATISETLAIALPKVASARARLFAPSAVPGSSPLELKAVAALVRGAKISDPEAIVQLDAAAARAVGARQFSESVGGEPPAGWIDVSATGLTLPQDYVGARLTPPSPAHVMVAQSDASSAGTLAGALRRGDWSDSGLADPAAAAIAGESAYKRGLISLGQFVTLIMRWEALADFGVGSGALEPTPILDAAERLTPESREIFVGRPKRWNVRAMHWTGLSEPQAEDFARRLARLPVSERGYWFFNIPRISIEGRMRQKPAPWAKALVEVDGAIWDQVFPAPLRRRRPDSRSLVLPSFGVLQAYLDAKFGKDATQLLPAFGSTSMTELLDGIGAGGRVLGLQFPGQEFDTTKAHGFELGRLMYTLHDFFHAYAASLSPVEYRRTFRRIYRIASEYRGAARQRTQQERVLDSNPVTTDGSEASWSHIARWYIADLLTPSSSKPFDGTDPESRYVKDFGSIRSRRVAGAPAFLSALIVRDMALHPEAWPRIDAEKVAETFGEDGQRLFAEPRGATAP